MDIAHVELMRIAPEKRLSGGERLVRQSLCEAAA
jgi:hypothetical protein